MSNASAKKLRTQFSYHLYSLASQLFSLKSELDYDKARESLRFILHKSQEYWVEPTGFLEKHRKVAGAVSVLHELLKVAIAPMVLFIFWLVFGYK